MIMTDLENAKRILASQGCTCVLCKGEKVQTTQLRGVKPLVQWLQRGEDFQDHSAADKVVGKATAFLYCLLGVKAVYAGVMSRGALAVLEENGIHAEYDRLVENIINRQGDGICPFEAAVGDIHQAQQALPAILEQMKRMGITL